MATVSSTAMYKYVLMNLCAMFNTKQEHGDIYINCKSLLKLLSNFYIYSTPPANPLDFPLQYFPFTANSQVPIIYTNTHIFNSSEDIINPSNKILTDLKITSLIITLLNLKIKSIDSITMISLIQNKPEGKEFSKVLYDQLKSHSKMILSNSIDQHVLFTDAPDLINYLHSVFSSYENLDLLLEKYSNTFGASYDFFR